MGDYLLDKAKVAIDEVEGDNEFTQRQNARRLQELSDYAQLATDSIRSFFETEDDDIEEV